MLADEAETRGFNEAERHQLVYRIQQGVMPEFVIADYGRVILEDEVFRGVFRGGSAHFMRTGACSAALDYFSNQDETILDLTTGQGVVFKRA